MACGAIWAQRLAAAVAAETAALLASTAARTRDRGTALAESRSLSRSSLWILRGRPCRRRDQASQPAAKASNVTPYPRRPTPLVDTAGCTLSPPLSAQVPFMPLEIPGRRVFKRCALLSVSSPASGIRGE